jgi:DNA repair protein RecN (Recombination protein N)
MITELRVENLAIIHQVELSFSPGFSVMTGETGAGKSLMIDALELALGERADTELVRTGATKASVQLVIDLTSRPDISKALSDADIETEDGLIYIQRDVFAEGKSQARLNGRSVPVSVLKQVGRLLVDLHGQHQHQSLLDPEGHVQYLDQWIGREADEALSLVAGSYAEATAALRQLETLRKGVRDREQRLDMLKFQVAEIESFGVREGEEVELENLLSRLKNVEKISSLVASSVELLSDGETNARDLLASGLKSAQDTLRFDTALEASVEQLSSALSALEEGIHGVRSYLDELENDPNLIDETQVRLDSLRRLKRKYGDTEQAILEFLQSAVEELSQLENAEANEEVLAQIVEKTSQKLIEDCAALTKLRTEKAVLFAKDVKAHLADLSMEKAQFEVRILPVDPTAIGADQVEFMFSANAGEEIKPLAKIASGGEISRVMLSMKSALAGRAGVPTLIFDEVDTGLGGKAAAAVGKKLQQLGEHYQVIAISHLPQVASRGTHHYRIEKREIDGRVRTEVNPLKSEDRVEEIARMLSGEALSNSALTTAREMLL